MSVENKFRFHLYTGSSLKEKSNWYPDLYSAELATFSYLSSNPMTPKNTLYLVCNRDNKYSGIYLEDTYEVVKVIYGSLYKNSSNCYYIPSINKDLESRFENTMLFSEDELIYKKAKWIASNKYMFKNLDNSYKSILDSFEYNEYICNRFHLKCLLYLGLDPSKIPWEHIESHPDLRDYINEHVDYDSVWLSAYRENMLDLVILGRDLHMLECKFNNLMNHLNIWDIFEC